MLDKDWKALALRFARSIVRFDNNDWARNVPESTVLLARRVLRGNKQRSRNVPMCGRQERSLVQSGDINQVLQDYNER